MKNNIRDYIKLIENFNNKCVYNIFEARIYNKTYLEMFIYDFSTYLSPKAAEFIKRIILKATQNSDNQKKPELPPTATEWDKNDLKNGTLVDFIPSVSFQTKLEHIRDWLLHPQVTEQELNSLRGIQDIDIAYEHADRFFDRLNKKASSDEDESGLETIMSWPDGFKLVKLNTAQCLNREGKLMQHCVGSYAAKIKKGTEILSLRDPQNNPHVTIEKDGDDIKQIKGKNNKAPIEKYYKYILDYLAKNNINNILALHNLGLIEVNGKIYEFNNLPDNLTINRSLYLNHTNITKLPENLTINGSLSLVQCENIKELPKGLKITGSLFANRSSLKTLPEDLEVEKSINIAKSNIKELPKSWNGKTINGDLNISNCHINELPENLTINGSLDIVETLITKLPDTLKVSGEIITTGRTNNLRYVPKHLKDKIVII